jgi:hypothetical protein
VRARFWSSLLLLGMSKMDFVFQCTQEAGQNILSMLEIDSFVSMAS